MDEVDSLSVYLMEYKYTNRFLQSKTHSTERTHSSSESRSVKRQVNKEKSFSKVLEKKKTKLDKTKLKDF
ncbi:CLUMA_CG007946, isoform A [Clunio marinus]|uniref:CLUMA_CG007946, isoform A n=1 Tax=Clunio marinus TaxID=568069 RepID=A0A1J1I278_9DIPT|nr:CLUMA_CG007946, isoform A [Clunio marinus]